MIDDGETPRWLGFGRALIPALEVAAQAYVLREHCESPIEVMLGAQINALIHQTNQWGLALVPQYKLERFRFDFALQVKGESRPVILIECDGRDFHSTPEQVENDKHKDAAARRAGMKLLRFTGSDIHRNGRGCALVALNEFIQQRRQ